MGANAHTYVSLDLLKSCVGWFFWFDERRGFYGQSQQMAENNWTVSKAFQEVCYIIHYVAPAHFV